jgi:hypothetical protein
MDSSTSYPLNAWDRYFVLHESPGCINNSYLFVDTLEPWNQDALREAVDQLLTAVPYLRSVVKEGFWGMSRRVPAEPAFSVERLVHFHDAVMTEPQESAWLDRPFDLEREVGFRIDHYRRPDQATGYRLTLTVHHSLADGTGQGVLFEELVRFYNGCLAPPVPGAARAPIEPRAIGPDEGRLRFRDLVRKHKIMWRIGRVLRSLSLGWRIRRYCASLWDDEAFHPSASAHFVMAIAAEDWRALGVAAKAQPCSRNNLLLAVLLKAADRWRRSRNRPDRDFHIALPADLRGLFGLKPSLQNLIGTIQLLFRPGEVRGRELARLAAQRVEACRTLDPLMETTTFTGAISLVTPNPLLRRALISYDRDPGVLCYSFALSSIRLPREPTPTGLCVENVWVRGSLTRQLGLGIVVSLYGERVTLAIEYLDAHISRASVEDFSHVIREELAHYFAVS